MKKKQNFRYSFLLLISCFVFGYSQAQQKFEKTFQEIFDDKNYIKVDHRNGPIEVLPSTDGKVTIKAILSLKARTPEDAQIVFDHFTIDTDELGDRSSVSTSFKTRKWQSNNGVVRIEFEDRQKVKDIRDLNIKMEIYTPKLRELHIANRYGDVKLAEETHDDLSVTLYSGNLEASDIKGNLELELKYSKANIGNFKDASLELYDSKLYTGNGEKVAIESKYSEFELGDFSTLDIESYDDKYELGSINRLSIKDKYSEFELKDFEDARMDLYDADIEMNDGKTLKLKSKYSKIAIRNLVNFDCELSYDDKIAFSTLGRFIAESKYTDFSIGQLKSKFILESYDDEVSIGKMVGPLEEISFNGKYTDLLISLPKDSKYLLEANTKYGKFSYPEASVERVYHVEKNGELEFKGQVKGSSDNSPKIKIASYDGKIVLN